MKPSYPRHRAARVLRERLDATPATAPVAPGPRTQAKLDAINERLARLAGGAQ
jgi:hypothetical protein